MPPILRAVLTESADLLVRTIKAAIGITLLPFAIILACGLVFLIQFASPGNTDDQQEIVRSRFERTAQRFQTEKTIVNNAWMHKIAGKPDTLKECHGVS